jgi:hypothetical protein
VQAFPYAAPRYQIRLTRVDDPSLSDPADPMGLARGRVVGLRTATVFLEPQEADQVLHEWLEGGDGERAGRWRGDVVPMAESQAVAATAVAG